MKRLILLVGVCLLAGSLASCGSRDEIKEEVLRALHVTENLAYRYVYVDDRSPNLIPDAPPPLPDVEVQGLVEDDFRFKARVALNKVTAFDEVVHDDLLAVRFLEPGRLGILVNKEKISEENTKTEIDGVDSLTVLQSRRWVVDESAAPIVTVGRVQEKTLGQDPVLDAITALTYVEEAINQALDVQKFNPDDLTPAYNRSEDTFPKPEEGSGVTRYDLRRPKLPPAGGAVFEDSGDIGRPTTRHFRRMAIYVKDGRIIQVREVVDVRGKFLKDVVRYAKTFAKVSGASDAQVKQFSDALDSTPEAQRGNLVLEGLSTALQAIGDEPILRRNMTLELRDLGKKIAVDLPTTDVVKGALGFLIVSSTGKEEAEGETSGDSGKGAPAGSETPAEGGADPDAGSGGDGTDPAADGSDPPAGGTDPGAGADAPPP